jgi:hypothetical protein
MIPVGRYLANIFLAVSLGLVLYRAGWEFSTRNYLKGFCDSIIPPSDEPEQKVEVILTWIEHGPVRRATQDRGTPDACNPEATLNDQQLLEVCGAASNAFVNLTLSSGLHARRLLLLDGNNRTKPVVVETLIEDRWIVVDPSYHTIIRLPPGRPAIREELRNLEVFRAATQTIPNDPSLYTHEATAHVHLTRIPVAGAFLRRALNSIWPSSEESVNWTLLLERESFAVLTISIFLLCLGLAARLTLGWYRSSQLGIARVRLRDQLV